MVVEPLFAGYLCATHVGQTVRVSYGAMVVEGWLHKITHDEDRPLVHVVIYGRGERRADGSIRKVAHVLNLDPRAVVEVIET